MDMEQNTVWQILRQRTICFESFSLHEIESRIPAVISFFFFFFFCALYFMFAGWFCFVSRFLGICESKIECLTTCIHRMEKKAYNETAEHFSIQNLYNLFEMEFAQHIQRAQTLAIVFANMTTV